MTSAIRKLEKDLCRCCHSEGSYKSLYAPYIGLDIDEVVYSKLLRECFNIELAPVTEPSQYMLCTICDDCIQKLKDAMQFKLQVQKCERNFQTLYLGNFRAEYDIEIHIKEEKCESDDNEANVTAENNNSSVENALRSEDVDEKTVKDDDSKKKDYEDEKDFNWSDDDEIPLKVAKLSENKTAVTKPAPSKNNKVAEIVKDVPSKAAETPQKNIAKKIVQPAEEEVIETIQGTNKVVKRPALRLLKGIDYKQVGNLFHCCRCEHVNNSFGSLKKHALGAHIPSFTCPVCSKMFKTISSFLKHKLEEHNIDDRIKCNACDRGFSSNYQLNNHMESFHKLGETRKCDKCDFETSNRLSLNRHMVKHKPVKDFSCKHCSKSFKRISTLQLHERIHTGDKRRVCKVCGQTFVQKASLNYHMTKYHPSVNF